MPRKIGVYARNREYILRLVDAGWDFRSIANRLKKNGEMTSYQNLHKSYLRDRKKQETKEIEESQDIESYLKIHHPKIFKEWLAYGRAATKQMPPVKKGAAKKIDAPAVDRLWETVKDLRAFEKTGKEELAAWVRAASENSGERKTIFQGIARILEKEYASGNLTEARYQTVKGWVEYVFYDSPEAALEFVNANAGNSFKEWRKAFRCAMGSIADKNQHNQRP